MENTANTYQSHQPTIWLTGLSGSGKSTIAKALHDRLTKEGLNACVLDGDELRKGLNSNLGFSHNDRKENVRRVAEVAKLMNDAGLISIVALISPYQNDRQLAKTIIGHRFIEIFVNTNIDVCRKRDPKGLYKKVEAGQITKFTGIDAPYEISDTPDLIICTDTSVEYSVNTILKYVNYQCNARS